MRIWESTRVFVRARHVQRTRAQAGAGTIGRKRGNERESARETEQASERAIAGERKKVTTGERKREEEGMGERDKECMYACEQKGARESKREGEQPTREGARARERS